MQQSRKIHQSNLRGHNSNKERLHTITVKGMEICSAKCCTRVVFPVPVSPTNSIGSFCWTHTAIRSKFLIAWPVHANNLCEARISCKNSAKYNAQKINRAELVDYHHVFVRCITEPLYGIIDHDLNNSFYSPFRT